MGLENSPKWPHLLLVLCGELGALIVLVVNLSGGQVDHVSEVFKINTLAQRIPLPESDLKKIDDVDEDDRVDKDDNTA